MSLGRSVSRLDEVVGTFAWGYAIEDVARGGAEGVGGARCGLAQPVLDLGEEHLDRVQVRGVLRQEERARAGCPDGLAHRLAVSIKSSQRSIKCGIKKGCETPITVFADKEKIRQVMSNLVENAIKYGKDNGNIVVSVYNTDGRVVLVEISDDGIGIDEEHLLRIFERFYRTDAARSRDKGGTGLGLAICKHIIEAHGHSIHVRSTIDVGTTIGFTLDARRD